MNKIEKQKRFDFVCDLKLLAEQYGYTTDEAMSLLGFKPKTEEDLLLEKGQELYPIGAMFIPIGKNRPRQSSGKIEILCDRAWVWSGTKMFQVYEPEIGWAEIIN